MVHLLAHRTLSVTAIQNVLSLTQVLVSKHLAYLFKNGMLDRSRAGNMVFYRLATNPPPEFDLVIDCLKKCAAHVDVLQRDVSALEQAAPDFARIPHSVPKRPRRPGPSRKDRSSSVTEPSEPWLFHGGDEYVD